MLVIEFLERLTKEAKRFRNDRNYFERNSHMHHIKKTPSQDVVDSVLTGFINSVGMSMGVDYGMYVEDLRKNED